MGNKQRGEDYMYIGNRAWDRKPSLMKTTPVSKVASALERKTRVIAIHWWKDVRDTGDLSEAGPV
jgi:hypothetical protein